MGNLGIFRDRKLEEKFEDGLFARNIANANGNLDERTFNGRRLTASNTIFKEVALEKLVSRTTARNHRRNRVYIHDLDSYASGMHNCLSIPIDRLLEDGFVVRQQVIRPPKSLRSACQLLAVVMQCQSQCQFGGVSYTHIDYTLEPFVRMSFYKHYKIALRYFEGLGADDIKWINPKLSITSEKYKVRRLAYRYAMEQTEEEAKQSIEALFHNLNSLQSRAGEQVPFSSINYGLCTSEEGRIIIKAILEATIKGGGNGQTYIFPCQIFQLRKGVNRRLGDPNYDLFRLALKSTAKRIYPNYYNCDWSNEADSPKGLLESPSTMGL